MITILKITILLIKRTIHFIVTKVIKIILNKKCRALINVLNKNLGKISLLGLKPYFCKMSINIQNISKFYGEQKALDAISFSIKKGEIVGFLGPNGAGKSTTMKIINGFVKPTEGTVFINDISVLENPIEAQKVIGYLPEHNPLYLDMYVKEYLNFMTEIHKVDKIEVSRIVEKIGLKTEAHKKIKQLSKGYRQRVGLASAMLHNPDVLILDEPTTGLDPNQLVEIRNLIKEFGKNKTVLFSTHIMQEVTTICNRVIIINKGLIVADKQLDEIDNLENLFRELTT